MLGARVRVRVRVRVKVRVMHICMYEAFLIDGADDGMEG